MAWGQNSGLKKLIFPSDKNSVSNPPLHGRHRETEQGSVLVPQDGRTCVGERAVNYGSIKNIK